MNPSKDDLWDTYTRIFLVESLYWIVSIGAVFTNDFILEDSLLTDDLTVFLTFFQVSFSLALLLTLNKINSRDSHVIKPYRTHINRPRQVALALNDEESGPDSDEEIVIENLRHNNVQSDSLIDVFIVRVPRGIDLNTCKSIFPLSVLYVGMLLLNNYCLKNVGVAFYFVSRSLTTVFNVIFTYLLIDRKVSKETLMCCCLIILGFLLGIDQESILGSLSGIGIGFGISSSLFTSLFSIFTKKKLEMVDNNIWSLILYNNFNGFFITIPLLLIHGDVVALIDDRIVSASFWTLLSLSGVMAFLISMVTNASIKFTSPLTHNISGTAKSCLQTILAVCYRHEVKSILWWLSNLIILLASAAYSRVKQLEMERNSGLLPVKTQEDSSDTQLANGDFETTDTLRNKQLAGLNDSHTIKFKPLMNVPA